MKMYTELRSLFQSAMHNIFNVCVLPFFRWNEENIFRIQREE